MRPKTLRFLFWISLIYFVLKHLCYGFYLGMANVRKFLLEWRLKSASHFYGQCNKIQGVILSAMTQLGALRGEMPHLMVHNMLPEERKKEPKNWLCERPRLWSYKMNHSPIPRNKSRSHFWLKLDPMFAFCFAMTLIQLLVYYLFFACLKLLQHV